MKNVKLLLILLIILSTSISILTIVSKKEFSYDEGAYFYSALRVSSGDILYKDFFWMQKTPGIIFIIIPFVKILLWAVYPLIAIAWFVFSIIYAVEAYEGKKFKIPYVYEIVNKIVKL